MGDDVLDAAWESLHARRREWALDAQPDYEGFHVKPMGGAWARVNLSKDYDAFRGVAKAGAASDRCRTWNVTMSAHFAIEKHGEEHARRPATAWVHRMCFYLALSHVAGDDFTYSAAVLATYVEPLQVRDWDDELPLASCPVRERLVAIRALVPRR